MPNYRRMFEPGGSWFFTVNLRDRSQGLLVEHVDQLHRAFWLTQQKLPFEIDALVILPDHLHAVLTLPPDDTDFPTRWREIKVTFSKAVPKQHSQVWQRGYWEHLIRDDRDLSDHIDYCWVNPVKHGLVSRVEDWPHSTFHRDHEWDPKPGDFGRALGLHAAKFGD